MASNPDNCAICDRSPSEGVRMGSSGVSGGLSIECPRCGRYELIGTEAMAKSFSWLPKLRGALSCAARQGFEGGQPIRISGGNAEELAQPHMNTRVSDNQERLLREVAKRADRPHMSADFSLARDFTLIDCYSREEFEWYIEWLEKEGLAFPTRAGPEAIGLTLSMKGWKLVQPFPRPGGIPGR